MQEKETVCWYSVGMSGELDGKHWNLGNVTPLGNVLLANQSEKKHRRHLLTLQNRV